MHSWAQWWLVITSPSAETKLPEQPPARRAEERRTWSSHAWSGAKPYFLLTACEGKLLKVHIPSSARAAEPASTASRANRFMGRRWSHEGAWWSSAGRPLAAFQPPAIGSRRVGGWLSCFGGLPTVLVLAATRFADCAG